jgi:hypothetical protein
VAPGRGRHIAFFSHVDLTFHPLLLRDTGASGPGFKIFYSSPLESPMDVNFCLRRRFFQRGFPLLTTTGLLLLLASSTYMTCLYDLPLRPASAACFYGLPLRPASTVCLHHVIAIIIIVHLLFKRNIYFSLLYVINVFLFFIS